MVDQQWIMAVKRVHEILYYIVLAQYWEIRSKKCEFNFSSSVTFLQNGKSYFQQSGLFNIHSLDLLKRVKNLTVRNWVQMSFMILFCIGSAISQSEAIKKTTEITPTQGASTQEKFKWPTGPVLEFSEYFCMKSYFLEWIFKPVRLQFFTGR